MASGNLKAIKRRLKSVNNTMKITKAMELVASSKLRKAKEQLENSRPFFNTTFDTMQEIARNNKDFSSVYTQKNRSDSKLFIVIAGDRGLAGGYNSNVLKLAASGMDKEKDMVVALGNKSNDYFSRRDYNIAFKAVSSTEDMKISDLNHITKLVLDLFKKGKISEVSIVYTNLVTSLTQEPTIKKILPLIFDGEITNNGGMTELISYEPSAEVVFDQVVPTYVTGILYGAMVDAYASEQGARRNAMESATDNSKDIIEKLDILYNRARQSAITQEISEIVGGSEALS